MKYLLIALIIFPYSIYADISKEIVFSLNKSIVKIHAVNESGNHGVGSGVVVSKDHVVTNCHVIANAKGVHVTKYGVSYSPEQLIADWHNDICILTFKYLELPPVELGSTKNMTRGDDVMAKSFGGNALRPVTATGKIREIFDYDGKNIIQSSTWFSLGASGGGLFDDKGAMIGVTTFKTPGRRALYFSVPIEVVKKLLDSGERITVTSQAMLPFWDEPPEKLPYFMRIVKPLFDENWEDLKAISQEWQNKEKKIEADFYIALSMYHLGNVDESKKMLENLLINIPEHALAHNLISKIYRQEGNNVKSAYHIKVSTELDSEIQETHN